MQPMNVHCLQHAAGEGIGKIGDWIRERGHALSESHLYRPGPALPEVDALDFLVIMGGGMNVYEYRNHPWLPDEKRFIERAIDGGKAVLGICLGAQLIADVLGVKVYQNAEFEIGWFPVRFNDAAHSHPLFEKFPRELTAAALAWRHVRSAGRSGASCGKRRMQEPGVCSWEQGGGTPVSSGSPPRGCRRFSRRSVGRLCGTLRPRSRTDSSGRTSSASHARGALQPAGCDGARR